jgi:hypothetical protein
MQLLVILLRIMLLGQPPNTGTSVSFTLTVNVQLTAAFIEASTPVTTTVVTPLLKVTAPLPVPSAMPATAAIVVAPLAE